MSETLTDTSLSLRAENQASMPDLRCVDFGLVPEPYRGWLLQRPDILAGQYSFIPNRADLRRNPQAEVKAEMAYFNWMQRTFPQYMALLDRILMDPQSVEEEAGVAGVVRIGRRDISPMNCECRVAVVIPAKDEEITIYNTLEGYVIQLDRSNASIAPETFEVNVLVNTAGKEPHDRTFDEVARFKHAHPQLRVNVLEVKFEKRWGRVGMARKLVTDLVLKRALQRQSFYREPLYIEQEDADLVWVDPRQVATIIDSFDQHPELDVLIGYQEKYLRLMANVEFIFMSRRVWDLMTAQAFSYLKKSRFLPETCDFNWTRPFTYGTNTAITAEIYSLIGGYDWNGIVGEDLDIGKRVSLLRGRIRDNRYHWELATLGLMRTRINSSPRRYLWALINDCGCPYSKANFQNGDLRKVTLEEMVQAIPERYLRLTEDNKRFYEKELWFLYESLRKIIPDRDLAEFIMRRSLLCIGFKHRDFEVEGDQVCIRNAANFSDAMEQYRRIKGVPIDRDQRL